MGDDVLQWRAGAESLIAHQEETGEVAHWAENMFSGMPATTISHPPQVKNIDNTLLSALQFIYPALDRKSTRLNSSHVANSYAVFCLKKKNTPTSRRQA